MSGTTDLQTLIKSMQPTLDAIPFGYASVVEGTNIPDTFATVREAEGVTVIAPVAALRNVSHQGPFARISLTVHSSLAAVGLTAAVSSALAKQGISANMIAGYYHDHIFVAWNQRDAALQAIINLSKES
jgi:uncharacterized protein